jgi:hypothetical protein
MTYQVRLKKQFWAFPQHEDWSTISKEKKDTLERTHPNKFEYKEVVQGAPTPNTFVTNDVPKKPKKRASTKKADEK